MTTSHTDSQRATGASKKPQSAPRQRRKRKPLSESPSANERVPGLSYPVMDGEDLFTALGRLRREAEIEIERLLAFLDELDGDPDLEPAGDELDNGGDLFSESEDDEPSLGSRNSGDQTNWAFGLNDAYNLDAEGDEHDGAEPDVDAEEDDPGERNGDEEPELGWTVEGVVGGGNFIVDGEQGGLSVPELDRLRETRRARHHANAGANAGAIAEFAQRRVQNCTVQDQPLSGSDGRLVMVTRSRGGIGNVRAMTLAEKERYLAYAVR